MAYTACEVPASCKEGPTLSHWYVLMQAAANSASRHANCLAGASGAHIHTHAAGKKVQQILYRQFLYALDEALGAAGASPRDRVSPWKLPAGC